MRRCILILHIILCGINLYAQISDLELRFLAEYGINSMSPCDENQFTSMNNRNNCHNLPLRGKDIAPLFVPDENSPFMTVRLNLIFIQKDDGTGNFQENDMEHQAFFDDVIIDLNRRISSLVMPDSNCFHGSEAEMIHDTRLRFVDRRFYVKKTAVWNNNLFYSSAKLRPNSYWYLRNVNDSLNNTLEDTEKAINVYFTEDSTQYHHYWEIQNLNDTISFNGAYTNSACSEFPSYDNWQKSSQLHMPCEYSKYWLMKFIIPQLVSYNQPSWENVVRLWHIHSISASLAHELGHSFNLLHPIDENDGSSFYPSDACTKNIMNPSGGGERNFLHPLEIGRMYVSTMTTNLQQYIPENTYLGTTRIDTTISLPSMRIYHSLIISNHGNVSVSCDQVYSPQCIITIENGGILSINGASLQSVQNTWIGIVVNSGGQLILSDVDINDYNIVVNNGGSVVIKNNLSIRGDHSIRVYNGGYLCVDNNASISLIDRFSTIEVSPNANLSCPSCNDNCLSTRSALTNSGEGCFVLYEGNEYIQNTSILTDTIVDGNNVFVGYDVTDLKPEGNVIVENGGRLRIKTNETTTLTKCVEVKLGGELKISK